MKTYKKLLKRVQEMERRYDELSRVLAELEEALSAYERLQPDLEILRDYMDSGQWRKDFEADEDGRIPADLKRGVLSEDGLYNALQDADGILMQLKQKSCPAD